jgi:hypothetical protein
MTSDPLRKIADAVLFEGYMLYPYRASAIKNRQRWNFGTLHPRQFAQAQRPEETSSCHAELILEACDATRLDLCIRFIQLLPDAAVAGQFWERGIVRNWTLPGIAFDHIRGGLTADLTTSDLATEPSLAEGVSTVQLPVCAAVSVHAEQVSISAFRLAITVDNLSPVPTVENASYEDVRRIAFTSAHLLLHAKNGAFVSLLDPPESLAAAVATCSNRGMFPVLAGESGTRTDVLCSPIILYDYPQIAEESAESFFDGTEIDEILTLRILTLSDEEKREMRSGDLRARTILERTENLSDEHLLRLHGVLRGLSPSAAPTPETDGRIDPWNPFDEKPAPASVHVCGIELRTGDRVRLRPRKRADILDSAMIGSIAIIETIEQDLDDNIQLAVVLEDDPGKDLGFLKQPGHRFFFAPEEVEPLSLEAQ